LTTLGLALYNFGAGDMVIFTLAFPLAQPVYMLVFTLAFPLAQRACALMHPVVPKYHKIDGKY